MKLRLPWRSEAKDVAFGSTAMAALLSALGGGPTKSGATVNAQTALQVSAVLACVRVIAEGVAQVPLKVYRKSGKSRDVAETHLLHDLLHAKPNAFMSSYELRETMGMHAGLTGNAFAFQNRIGSDRRPVELLPIEPGRVKVKRAADWTMSYEVKGDSGDTKIFPAEAIWHWRGPSWDSVVGMEIVRLAREAIGLAMATEESQAQLHQRGLRPSGLYSVDGALSKQQYEDLRGWLEKEYSGASNAGRIMLLDRSAKFQQLTQSGIDAQHLETRRHQVIEICAAMRVQPIMIGFSADKAPTFASAEQMFLAHVVHTLGPWYTRIEQSAAVQLLSDEDRAAGYYVKHVVAGLLRGALKDTSEYLSKLVLNGIMTRNEARELLELNPLDGLDEPLTPANMTVGQVPADPTPNT